MKTAGLNLLQSRLECKLLFFLFLTFLTFVLLQLLVYFLLCFLLHLLLSSYLLTPDEYFLSKALVVSCSLYFVVYVSTFPWICSIL